MAMELFLLGNTIFLAAILVSLVLVSKRNGYTKKTTKKVKEDLKKIKQQISADE